MSDAVAEIAKAYAFDGPALELGAVVTDTIAHPEARVRIPLSMLNRHGLVAGATGTGKTKTLQLMAEQLSDAGVPCVLADIKGDVSGMAAAGLPGDRISSRVKDLGVEWVPRSYPVEFLSIGGVGTGTAIRASISSFGPQLLAKVMDMNEVQTSSLGLVFHYADKAGLPLLDLKDLRAVIQWLTSDEGAPELKALGGLSRSTAGVILRDLIALEDQGANQFFGEPELDTADLLRTTPDGKGILSILELQGLQDRPALFSTFLMWLVADLFHDLPEVGDVDKPKLVFFFDEAHLLFDDASEAFLESIAQTVRLIRSKGIGIFFVTQTPKDVHPDVLAQLGNRIQHALRAFTPDDAKKLKATVSTFPKSETYDLGELLTQLGIGEAVVTILSERGTPTPVAWTRLRPPTSLMAQVDPAVQQALVAASPLFAKYDEAVDRDSAYERLADKLAGPPPAKPVPTPASAPGDIPVTPDLAPPPARERVEEERKDGLMDKLGGFFSSPMGKSMSRSLGTAVAREISRGVFGTATRRRSRRRR
ncbi:MAG: helicase HerA-like domain-containing protein [Mycobacteriales bacterium]